MAVTKEDLVFGVISVLNNGGMDALTVDALASHHKMSKSTLYKYYDGLQDLVFETVEYICEKSATDMENINTSEGAEATFRSVASVYAQYATRAPAAFLTEHYKLNPRTKLRLENMESRMGERMFRAALGLGASSSVAYAIRSSFEGMVRFTAKISDDKTERFNQLTDIVVRGLSN